KIMVSPEKHGPINGDGYPVARPDDDLDTLVGLSTGSEKPVLIKDGDVLVGVVSKDTLLTGLQGGAEA
ncbi:MAG: glycine/betaine ABC transporter, partial [Pseudomonadota bacterium]